ncbi:MAG: Asr1405/Asl0597 family protein [Dolichospermum sp.]
MKSSSSETDRKHVIDIDWADRWQVYQRLQELDIICICETNQPLMVEINNPTAAIQLWSVIQQFSASRQDLIENIENSWRIRYQKF